MVAPREGAATRSPAAGSARIIAGVTASTSPPPSLAEVLGRTTLALVGLAGFATLLTAVLRLVGADDALVFAVSAVALAGLAGVIGSGTDQLGHRLGPGKTGVLQSALGNLPELFISVFALQAGLVVVVQTALIGSILANSLLVLGLAFVAGGLRHGVQRFGARPVRTIAVLLLLAVAALAIPTLATEPGAPDAGHAQELSVFTAVVLLVLFGASIPFSIAGGPGASALQAPVEREWPLPVAIGVLAVAAAGAALVSDWFVQALEPSLGTLGISEAFAGLVVVAIAGNAVENVVGIQAAARNQVDLATSLIMNSSLQVALALTPALVLISLVVGGPALTLVLDPLLLGSLGLAVILGALIVFDGESTWLEGLALVALYLIIAASVWYGPRAGA
jgi:Ca2+:H+ antiporter